jgi:DNA adenine methylase
MGIDRNKPIRPFLKWAGNKYRILHQIHKLLPEGERLVEPFVGSGAVFLNTDFDDYLLCDSNRDLIDLYQQLKRRGTKFIDECQVYFQPRYNQESHYYRLRERFNLSEDRQERAALFLYLNRHGYNGLCRYNASGGFNVPFGRYKRPYFPEQEMRAFREKAQQASFRHQVFETTFRGAETGDVIYCDPPYVPLSASSNFTSYSAGGFSLEQQKDLVRVARETAAKGIPVLISNHDTPFTSDHYHEARLETFFVQRHISRNGQKRDKAGEILALFA